MKQFSIDKTKSLILYRLLSFDIIDLIYETAKLMIELLPQLNITELSLNCTTPRTSLKNGLTSKKQ